MAAPKRVLDDAIDESAAKRANRGAAVALYKWRWDIPTLKAAAECKVNTDGYPLHVKDDIRFDPAELEESAGSWAYYYARDRDISNVIVPATYHRAAVRFTRGMLPTQKEFLQCYAPRNRALLYLFFQSYAANLKLVGEYADGIEALKLYQGDKSTRVQTWLREHKNARSFNSFDDLDKQGETLKGATLELARDDAKGEMSTFPMYFYQTVFMSLTKRIAVPLPRGIILFEGRTSDSVERRVLGSSIRRETFSTSWHPNVGMRFAYPTPHYEHKKDFTTLEQAVRDRDRVLLVHKVMSDGILACDTQGDAIPANDHFHAHYTMLSDECEITVQPFVKIHVVDECIHLLQYNRHMTLRDAPNPVSSTFIRTIFTHLYLGDKCPCGHS